MRRRGLSLIALSTVALALFLVGFLGVASADHYQQPADVTPVTIPLWGPTWDHSPVTYSISAGRGVSQAAIDQVVKAVEDWNHAIAAINNDNAPAEFLVPAIAGEKAEIIIKVKSGGGMVQGQALCNSDAGFFTDCKVNVSGKAFGSDNPDDAVLSIAIQEIGHSLGLLHADNPLDVMFGTLQNPPNTIISVCDLKGWATVMAWFLDDPTNGVPAPPGVSSVSCGVTDDDPGDDPVIPNKLTLDVDDTRTYTNRDIVPITVTATDTDKGVAGVTVTVRVTTPKGKTLSASGDTGADGTKSFTYKVNKGRDGTGTFDVTATADPCTGDCNPTPTFFTVE